MMLPVMERFGYEERLVMLDVFSLEQRNLTEVNTFMKAIDSEKLFPFSTEGLR